MLRPPRAIALVFSVVLPVVGGIAACSDPPKRPGPASYGAPGAPLPVGNAEGGVAQGDAASEASDDAGECTDLELTGVVIDRVGVASDPPVSSGGVVVDGTYDLSVYEVFVGAGGIVGPTGITARSSIRMASGTLEQVLEVGGNSPSTTARTKSAYVATGAAFSSTLLCPSSGGGLQRQFTADGAKIVFTDLTTKEAFTFVKR